MVEPYPSRRMKTLIKESKSPKCVSLSEFGTVPTEFLRDMLRFSKFICEQKRSDNMDCNVRKQFLCHQVRMTRKWEPILMIWLFQNCGYVKWDAGDYEIIRTICDQMNKDGVQRWLDHKTKPAYTRLAGAMKCGDVGG